MAGVQPYRVFFPVGVLFGVLGVGFWIFAALSLSISQFFEVPHPNIMIGGFLFSFATGFLMTAVPRFSGTSAATDREIATMGACFIFLFISIFVSPVFFHALSLLNQFLLILFAARRIPKRTRPLPSYFIFVVVGLGFAVVGNIFFLASFLNLANTFLFAKTCYFTASINGLVLGIGSMLVPALTGRGPLPLTSIALREWDWCGLKVAHIVALVFVMGVAIDCSVDSEVGAALRTAAIAFVAIVNWRIHLRPAIPGVTPWAAWFAGWMCLLGNASVFLSTDLRTSVMHLVYIGGFSLLTFVVATRVILAHGGHDLGLEKNSKVLFIGLSFIGLAGMCRAAAPFLDLHAQEAITAAALFWLAGVAVWSSKFLRLSAHL